MAARGAFQTVFTGQLYIYRYIYGGISSLSACSCICVGGGGGAGRREFEAASCDDGQCLLLSRLLTMTEAAWKFPDGNVIDLLERRRTDTIKVLDVDGVWDGAILGFLSSSS